VAAKLSAQLSDAMTSIVAAEKLSAVQVPIQGDQIGRIFAYLAIVFFRKV
jgi:hypothetical protein